MTISFFHIRVKINVPHLLTPPYFENRRVTAEKVVSKDVTINYAMSTSVANIYRAMSASIESLPPHGKYFRLECC